MNTLFEILNPSYLLFPALLGTMIMGLVCPLIGSYLVLTAHGISRLDTASKSPPLESPLLFGCSRAGLSAPMGTERTRHRNGRVTRVYFFRDGIARLSGAARERLGRKVALPLPMLLPEA